MRGIIVVGVIIACVFIFIIYKKIKENLDGGISHTYGELREDAKVIDVETFIRGRKDPAYVTKVTFDDGFVFESPCSDVERHRFYNKLTLTPSMKQSIINGAILAHAKKLGIETENLKYEISSYKYKCGRCGHKGPYNGNCPNCGSNFKIADN